MLKTLFEGRWLRIESRPGARAAAIGCAVLVNWLIRTIGSAAGANFVVLDRGETTYVTYGVLAIFTTAIGLVGWAILAVLERVTRFGRAIWTAGAIGLLALSGVPIVFAHAALTTKLFLSIINTATAVVIVPVMHRTALRRTMRSRRVDNSVPASTTVISSARQDNPGQ